MQDAVDGAVGVVRATARPAAALVIALESAVIILRAPNGPIPHLVGVLGTLAIGGMTAGPIRRRGLRGTVDVVCGTVGVAAGAAALGRATINGVAWEAVLAVAALAGAGGIFAAGWIRLVTAVGRWWRLALLPAAFCVVQFGVIPLGGAAFGSQQPREPMTMLPPAGVETLSIPTADGLRLTAWYTPSRNGAAVLLLHGSGGNAASTAGHAAVLAAHGYGVLALDERGAGGSEGVAMAWGWYGDTDIRAALDALAARPDVDPDRLAVVGLSMGGEQAIGAAATDRRIRVVVAEGATGRTADDLVLPDDPVGVIRRLEATVMFGAADLLVSASAPVPLRDSVRLMAPTPLLLISGSDPDEQAADRLLRAAAPDTVILWELPDTPHTGGLARHPAAWDAAVQTVLDRAIGGGDRLAR